MSVLCFWKAEKMQAWKHQLVQVHKSICLTFITLKLFLHFGNNVKYQLKIAMHAFHLSFIALTDSIRLQKRTFFFSVLAYSYDL